MEQQEETSEQIHRKRRQISSSSRSTMSIPLDVVASEILSKLPAKSLMRFRCVSKLWSSITTDPYFTNTFETQSTKKRRCLLLCIKTIDKLLVFSLPQVFPIIQTSLIRFHLNLLSIDSYRMTCPKQSCCFSTKESVQGLICCFPEEVKPIIWNPTMRKFLTLTEPEKRCKSRTFFLTYDPIEGKHKVLCMPLDGNIDECQVLTLGSVQEPWRRAKFNNNHHPILGDHECINGVLYYKAYTDVTGYYVNIIMSFDVRSEKFHMINLPWNTSRGTGTLTPYQGSLACVTGNGEGGTTLWILKDAEKHDWSPKNFPAPFSYYYQSEGRHFHFIGITDAGEFVYVPSGFYKPFYVLYHDPERNRYHRVEFKGIPGAKFRLRNGPGERHLNKIHIVLNHIESLMSL